jgi:nucleoside phosphorylase
MSDPDYPDTVDLIKRDGAELHGFKSNVGSNRITVRAGVLQIDSIDELFAVRWASPFGLEYYRVTGGEHRTSKGQPDLYILSVKRDIGPQDLPGSKQEQPKASLAGREAPTATEDTAALRVTLQRRFRSLQAATQMETCHARMKQLWAELSKSTTVQSIMSELQRQFPNAQNDEAKVFTEEERKPESLEEAAAMYWWTLRQCGESNEDDIEWQLGMGVNRWSDGAETLQCFTERFVVPVMEFLDERLRSASVSTEAAPPCRAEVNRRLGMAVVLTALGLEYQAVLRHLSDVRERRHSGGTLYEVGRFDAAHGWWEVAVAEIGQGSEAAGIETERAIAFFKPEIVMFVGVAGGLKDVKLGDVVAADEVFNYESGKAELELLTRPHSGVSAHELIQRARAERRKDRWLKRLGDAAAEPPNAHVGPIAAGGKVVASEKSSTYSMLRKNYSHCLAVEMEGYGFLAAVQRTRHVSALVVRGISDLCKGKRQADAAGWQVRAARNASAFAFEVLSHLYGPPEE